MQIFEKAGFSKVSADLQDVAIGLTNLVFTSLAVSVIDRIGRKPLLLIGAAGTSICLAAIGAIFLTGKHQNLLLYCPIVFIDFSLFHRAR